MPARTGEPVGKQMSAQFKADFQWGIENYGEFAEKYAGNWVAIHCGRVVAAGQSIARIKEQARRETGCDQVAVFYADDGMTIYAH